MDANRSGYLVEIHLENGGIVTRYPASGGRSGVRSGTAPETATRFRHGFQAKSYANQVVWHARLMHKGGTVKLFCLRSGKYIE